MQTLNLRLGTRFGHLDLVVVVPLQVIIQSKLKFRVCTISPSDYTVQTRAKAQSAEFGQ